MSVTARLYALTMKFGFKQRGWTERHYMKQTTYADAAAASATLVTARMLLSPIDVSLTYAAVKVMGGKRDRYPVVLALPVKGTAATLTADPGATINNCENSARFDLATVLTPGTSTELATVVNHFVRGIPDALISEEVLGRIVSSTFTPYVAADYAIPTVTGATFTPNASDNWAHAAGNYAATLLALTRYGSKLPPLVGPPPVPQFEADDWTAAFLPQYSKKDAGRPTDLKRGRAPTR